MEPLDFEEANLITEVRQAGVQRDHSKLPLVRKAVTDSHALVVISAMIAAGRLGDTDSMPQIIAVSRRRLPHNTTTDFADLALARIQVENAVGRASSAVSLSNKVSKFLGKTRLSGPSLRGAGTAYARLSSSGRNLRFAPYEVQAIRHVADFVAEASEAGVPDAVTISGISFSVDHAARLKVKLALMPKDQRIEWLTETIARKTNLRGEDYYEVRALADEGTVAVDPLIEKLRTLKQNRAGYSYPGIKTLFRVLGSIGDRRAIPVVESFVGDKDTWLDFYARQELRDLENGLRTPYHVDY